LTLDLNRLARQELIKPLTQIGPLRVMLEEFEKRAAIMEFDGGLSRRDADREAALAVIRRYRLH
jgi:hypothetical protein